MVKKNSYNDFVADLDDGDDVEILEVVGVEDDAAAGLDPDPGPAPDDETHGEYVLDFDNPDEGLLDGTGRTAATDLDSRAEADADADDDDDSDHDRLLRLRADYDNLRKRIDRERQEFELHANCELVGQLLPVVDNLERALAVNSGSDADGALREGLVMIHRQLADQLKDAGLTPILTVGQPFDPNLHDAVATESTEDHPPNTILEEMQRGYLFQDRVLRPAMVKVSTPDGERGEEKDL